MHVTLRDGDVERRRAAHLRAAALLRGVPARPRVHRGARHHRADLRHLPGRLPDERACRRWRTPAASTVDRAAARRCAGCSTAASGSRATRCTSTCSTRPTSSATTARSRWPATTATIVERGLQLKKTGNEIMTLVGGREIHPINVRVGGFYRAPTRRELRALVEPLERARETALATVRWTAGFDFPDFERDYELVALVRARRVPDRPRAGSSRTAGSTSRPREFDDALRRGARRALERAARAAPRARHLPRRPARPLRLDLDRLSPLAREAAREAGLGAVCRNPFRSIVVRSVELVYACDEALAHHRRATSEPDRAGRRGRSRAPASATARPRRRAACSTTATRSTPTARSSSAKIVPPTSQNQRRDRGGPARRRRAARSTCPTTSCGYRCEQAIRNYDPCISCATHFLDLEVDRG